MKKRTPTTYLLSSIFYLLSSTSLTSAGPVEGVQQLADGFGQVIMILIKFVSNTILNMNSFSEFLFAKLILFTIILTTTYSVLKKSKILGEGKSAKNTNIIISVSVSILSIRFIPDNEFMNSLLLPYGALASAIITILPLAIFFFFVHENLKGSTLRRAAWTFYGAFFIGLWWMRWEELSETVGYIYMGAFVFIFISFMFDGQIHKIWGVREMNRFLTGANQKTIAALQAEYMKIASLDSPHGERRREFIRKKLRELGAGLP